jgi:hypothetical protein
MHALAIALALTLTADPKTSTMKDLLKDAVAAADGGAGHNEADGPDVSKLPFTKDSIAKVVTFHQPKIQTCYEETLAVKDKAVEGTLSTSWIITPEGMVKSAKVEKKGTTLKDGRLHDCVVAVISSMNFPTPPGGKQQPITYPFNLKALK